MHEKNKLNQKKGIYLVPNMITTAGLFFGFYAIVSGIKGDFEYAAISLFIAMLMDTADGRVARITNTQSDFGAQLDSLSDMVCFGVTPALVAYSWGLQYLGKLGWLAAFFYVAATALRLARFNINLGSEEEGGFGKQNFTGLPCPAAAAVVASMVWIGTDFAIPGKVISYEVAALTAALGFLMVSNINYYSFKDIDFRGKVPFVGILLCLLIILLVAWDPPKVLFSVFSIYALSGVVGSVYDFFTVRAENKTKLAVARATLTEVNINEFANFKNNPLDIVDKVKSASNKQ